MGQYEQQGRKCDADRLTRFDDERFSFDPAHNLIPPNRTGTSSAGRVEDDRLIMFEDKRYIESLPLDPGQLPDDVQDRWNSRAAESGVGRVEGDARRR